MDNRPYKPDEVEYVEAEPIGPEPQAPYQAPRYQGNPLPGGQVYYSRANCVPCCGPVGCLSLILVALLVFTDLDVRPLIFALSIFTIVSFIARIMAAGR